VCANEQAIEEPMGYLYKETRYPPTVTRQKLKKAYRLIRIVPVLSMQTAPQGRLIQVLQTGYSPAAYTR